MKKFKFLALLILGFTAVLIISGKQTEQMDQENKMSDGMKVYPVPIPSQLQFAGEAVPLEKFEIKERLDRELLVNSYWQSNTLLILKRTQRAFAVIEPILAKNGIPDDFKYLAVAESGLLNVTSPAGAKGIWQFMPSSGKSYGLSINRMVDERYHLEKSTEAACLYLKKAYNRFGSWTLAAASYNRGINGINKDLNKQLVSDYFDMHLNTETSRYILRIIALKTIIENPSSYGFYIEDKDFYSPIETIDIYADSTIQNISEYAASLGTNYHVLKSLNPWIKGNELIITNKPYIIKAPLNK
ncbi:MAG: murein transglycosylase [Bacteroidetes bacterium]|nr:MAG: murein transglycosylase [Bacteroidota bacterium]